MGNELTFQEVAEMFSEAEVSGWPRAAHELFAFFAKNSSARCQPTSLPHIASPVGSAISNFSRIRALAASVSPTRSRSCAVA